MFTSAVFASLIIWLIILLLPWQPWSTKEQVEAQHSPKTPALNLGAVTALVPARNESAHILQTLKALAQQGSDIKIIVVDDESSDETGTIARGAAIDGLMVLDGQPPPRQWTGKLWALQQGLEKVKSEFVLLMDADIELKPGLLPAIVRRMEQERLDFLSLMAELKMDTFWERLLVPAFIFFFKLLYPFKLSNDSRFRQFAAAAGGCVLVRRSVLNTIGGFSVIRDALIDDCSFAFEIKKRGYRTWIGLTRSVTSLRPYTELSAFWNMVARTAYSQLKYSPLLLMVCTLLMLTCFLVPLLALFLGSPIIGVASLLVMFFCYTPVLRFYQRPVAWALSLPLAGLMFLGMTWTSAWRYYQGERSSWKGRTYSTDSSS